MFGVGELVQYGVFPIAADSAPFVEVRVSYSRVHRVIIMSLIGKIGRGE